MSQALTLTNIIDEIKRRGLVPTNQSTFNTTDFEEFINDELFSRIVPTVMSVNEEYFVNSTDLALVSGQDEYDIPSKAIGGKLRDIWLVDSAGNRQNIPRYSLEEVSQSNYVSNNNTSGFYIKGNKIVLINTPTNSSDSLRVFYFRRPNKLAGSSQGGQVTNVNTGLNQLTLTSVPASWVNGSSTLDIQTQALNFDLKYEDVVLTTKSGFTITIPDVTGISVGDWVFSSGYAGVPMVPIEAHRLLAHAATIKTLEAMGDFDAADRAEKKYMTMKEEVMTTISPRVDGAPKKVVALNGVFNSSRNYSNWRS